MKKGLMLALASVAILFKANNTIYASDDLTKYDVKQIYEKANKKIANLQDVDKKEEFVLNISNGSDDFNIVSTTNTVYSYYNLDDLKLHSNTETDMLDKQVNLDTYYEDGNLYLNVNGEKVKQPLDVNSMNDLDSILNSTNLYNASQKQLTSDSYKDFMEDISLENVGKDQKITLKADNQKFDTFLNDFLTKYAKELGIENPDSFTASVDNISEELLINEDGYVSNSKVNLDIDLVVNSKDFKLSGTYSVTYNNPGSSVYVETPDLKGYKLASKDEKDLSDVEKVKNIDTIAKEIA